MTIPATMTVVTTPAAAATLIADVFPCEVVMPDHRVERRVRAFIFDDGIVVYADRGNVPVKVFAARHADQPVIPSASTSRIKWRATLNTTEGTIHINRTSGCGCHSPLLRLIPSDVHS